MCAVQIDTFMTGCIPEFYMHVEKANAVRQWMDASGGTPFLPESSSNISSRKQSISSQIGIMKPLSTRRISKLSSSLPLKISAFECAVYAINVAITDAFPPESRETLVQHKPFKYNMPYGKVSTNFANRCASIIQF